MAQAAKHPTLDFGSGSCALMCSNNESLTYKAGNNHSAKQWGVGCIKGGPYTQGNTM